MTSPPLHHRIGAVLAALGAVAFLMLAIGALRINGAGGQADQMVASVPEILGINAMYAGLFAGTGWLFARAAGHGTPELSDAHRQQ